MSNDHGRTPVETTEVGAALAALRQTGPLVGCITNIVVAQWTANVLLASGAAPAMVDHPDESGVFASVAQGLLVNTGTPYPDTIWAMVAAARGAHQSGTPWVLDPVAVGVLPARTGVAREVLQYGPTIIRGNASEIHGLAGGSGGRGVDSTSAPEEVLDTARELAQRHACVVAVSGAVDHITDGRQTVRVHNGHPMMTRVTGVGCALGALMAGFAAVTEPLAAATAATALMTVAADRAVVGSAGPGTFAVALIDELAAITPEELAGAVELS